MNSQKIKTPVRITTPELDEKIKKLEESVADLSFKSKLLGFGLLLTSVNFLILAFNG